MYDSIMYMGWKVVFDDDAISKTKDEMWREYHYEDVQRDIGDGVVIIELFYDGSGSVRLPDKEVEWRVVEQAIEHFKKVIMPEAIQQGYLNEDGKTYVKYAKEYNYVSNNESMQK